MIVGSWLTSGNVGQCRTMSKISYSSRARPKIGGRSWNRGAISRRSKVISTSDLMAAILNFRSGTMSGNVRSDIFKSGMVENVGIAVVIATPSFAVQKLFSTAILNFGSLPSSANVDQRHPAPADVIGVKSKSTMVESLQAAVGIASKSATVYKLCPVPVWRPPS